jgi:hypothetical protein
MQACRLLANGVNDCDAPVELDTKTTAFTLVPVASLAEAVYSDTVFGVEGNGIPGDFEAAKVTGVKTTGMGSPATGFEATGYKFSGGVSSRPVQLPVKKGEQFAVYSDDLFEPSWGSFYSSGTVNPAALLWPHVVQIWYRLPFEGGFQPGTGLVNIDDPVPAHLGPFRIVNGNVVPDVTVTYETLVQPSPPWGPKGLHGCHIPRGGEWFWSTNFDAPD